MGEVKKLFVYGTLMRGFENYNKYLKDKVKEIKKEYTYGNLYHLIRESCPALIEGKEKIWGEIITFYDDGNVLSSIDELELYFGDKHEIMYLREKREVFYENGEKEYIDVYVYKKDIKREPHIYIETGDWRTFLLKR